MVKATEMLNVTEFEAVIADTTKSTVRFSKENNSILFVKALLNGENFSCNQIITPSSVMLTAKLISLARADKPKKNALIKSYTPVQ